jgi:hypothetical protein
VNRVAIAALWISTIALTFLIVRSTARTDEPAASAAPRETVRHTHSLARSTPVPTLPTVRPSARRVDEAFFQQTLATLERDLADGRWGIADRDRLATALRRIGGDQAHQLYATLFPRLNSGAVKTELDGPPI